MGKTVVIVDDSRFVVEKLITFFKDEMRWNVVATGCNGNEAVSLYKQHKPDLLTVDISMPEKRGNEGIKEIIAEFPDAKILVISAVRSAEMIECLSLGAKEYIEKPLRFYQNDFTYEFKKTLADIFGPEINQ